MSRPASLGYAALPSAVYATALPTATTGPVWYSVSDAKSFLSIPVNSTDDDDRLTAAVAEGLGYLEEATGRPFKSTALTAEYGDFAPGHRVLRVDRKDALVTSLTKVAGDATETVVQSTAYEVLYRAGEPYVRLTGDEPDFDSGIGVAAKVAFTVGLPRDSAAVALARVAMNEWVLAVMDGEGEFNPMRDPRNSPGFKRAVHMLSDMGGGAGRIL